MVEGLGQDDVKHFMSLTVKANVVQVKAMLTMLQGELKKRELMVVAK